MTDVKAIFARIIDELGDENHLLEAFKIENLVESGARNSFQCQGCGMFCCLDKTIVLRPSEYYRIVWFLGRHRLPLRTDRWAAFGTGGMSGTPVARIAFEQKQKDGVHVCPFLTPVFDQEGKPVFPQGRCGIYPARPVPCRIYPYGRGELHDPKTGEVHEVITIAERCKGFETPPEREQTIAAFLQSSRPEAVREEVDICNRLLFSFAQAGLHERTPDNPTSLLEEGLAFSLLTPLLYTPPPCPADPADDHKTIMDHLRTLEKKRGALISLFGQIKRRELSLEEGIDQLIALAS
jgi:Fe-S-cluster containining protein